MGAELFRVNRMVVFDRLEFDDDGFFNEQVSAKAFVEFETVVFDGNRHLPADGKAAFLQFVRKGDLIDSLQKARSEMGVKLVGSIDDYSRDFVGFHIGFSRKGTDSAE